MAIVLKSLLEISRSSVVFPFSKLIQCRHCHNIGNSGVVSYDIRNKKSMVRSRNVVHQSFICKRRDFLDWHKDFGFRYSILRPVFLWIYRPCKPVSCSLLNDSVLKSSQFGLSNTNSIERSKPCCNELKLES